MKAFLCVVVILFAPAFLNAQKVTVRAIAHSRSQYNYTVSTPETTNTDCSVYPNSVNCRSTTYGGGSENKAVYRFTEIVTCVVDGITTQYTVSRTARWVWNSMDYLTDGDYFPAEIKGKHMVITVRRGGNQGKEEKLKYDVMDIRPAS